MYENCDFVIPINILTPFVRPVFLGCTTHYHVSSTILKGNKVPSEFM